jgi:hypothetical protein
MARQTWAVYSVRDHLPPYAFVTDVLLYDCVRVPVPSDDDRDRWVREGWKPERQARLLEVLGNRAQPLVWDAEMREHWRSNYRAAKNSARQTAPDAFRMTRDILVESLPRRVTGVDTICAYQGWNDLQADAQLTFLPEAEHHPGIVAAAIAWSFAVPSQLQSQPADLEAELDVLAAAVQLSDRKAYRRNRRSYWRWVREFSSGTLTGQDAIEDAVEELEELVEEQHELVRAVWIDRAVRTGFLLGTVTLGMLPPLTPAALALAALSVGQFTWAELRDSRGQVGGDDDSRVTAMFCQIDKQLRQRFFQDHR